MSLPSKSPISEIPLEQPASIRRQLPLLDSQGWLMPSYVVGEENAGLLTLFEEHSIASLEEKSPVVLYGDHQTGKTALAVTLAVRWSRLTALRPLTFCTGTSFAKDFLEAIEVDDLEAFYHRFRRCKLLLIDDLQSIASKPAAQQELAITLDHLAEAGAPVVATCSKLPASLAGIQPALASRLSGGFSMRLSEPQQKSQAAIVEMLSKSLDSRIDPGLLVSFVKSLPQPIHASDLKSIVSLAHHNRDSTGNFDLDLVQRLVQQTLLGSSLGVSDIAKAVARTLRVKLSDMRGSTRQANIVRARGLAILLARKLTDTSLQQIGEFFGGRDHSTILHSYRKTENLLESDSELAKAMSDLQVELLQK